MGKSFKRHVKDIGIISLIGIPWGYLICPECNGDFDLIIRSMIVSSFFWVLMWKGNELMSDLLDRHLEWLKMPTKRFIWGILGHTVCTVAIMVVIYLLFNFVIEFPISFSLIDYLFSIGITLAITLFIYSRKFLLAWKQLSIKDEKLQRENILSKYETLKNQVNPHFLFNSFNTLTTLIEDDPESAIEYIKELSNLYRYILETKEMEMVDIENEMRMVNSYIYLQKKRFGNALRLDCSLKNKKFKVPPLALQMLVENAVKHNIINKNNPLSIKITSNEGTLSVSNNLQKKDTVSDGPGNVGLKNLDSRYRFLSEKGISIRKTDGVFKVELPILT